MGRGRWKRPGPFDALGRASALDCTFAQSLRRVQRWAEAGLRDIDGNPGIGPILRSDAVPYAVPARPGAEGQILDAARRCLLMYGSAKMSVDDVARLASVSRRTVYTYFGNRNGLISAVVDWSLDTIFDEIEKVLARNERFDDQAAGAAVSLWQSRRAAMKIRWGGLLSEEDEAFLLSRGSGPVLRRLIELLRPGLEQARQAGEVRADLDVESACEWVARQAFSLSSVVESSFQVDGRAGIDDYIRSYVIRGLVPEVGVRGRGRSKTASAGQPKTDGSRSAVSATAFFDPSQTVTFPGRAPTEARVLDGARKCMIQVGIDAMTIDMVMAAAGLARGTDLCPLRQQGGARPSPDRLAARCRRSRDRSGAGGGGDVRRRRRGRGPGHAAVVRAPHGGPGAECRAVQPHGDP